MSILQDMNKEIKKYGFFKGLKSTIKSIFMYDKWCQDEDNNATKEWETKKEEFYIKAKPIVENYINENGYEGIASASFEIDGEELKLNYSWNKGPKIKQIWRIISESFQKKYFGEVGIFDEDDYYDFGNPKTHYNSFVVLHLIDATIKFPFCGSKYYLVNRNPLLKYLVEYHKIYPEIKITNYLLSVVVSFFVKVAKLWTLDTYGDDYYDKLGTLNQEERRRKAWNSEELHQLLNGYTNPESTDNAALFARNIGDKNLTSNLEMIAADIVFKYIHCKYEDRNKIFFINEETNELRKLPEIERMLDEKEAFSD